MKTLLILSALLGIASAAYNLDLTTSIDRIQNQITKTKTNPPQWDKLERIIDDLLDCIAGLDLGGLIPPASTTTHHVPIFNVSDAKWMSPVLTSYIESVSYESLGRQLQTVDWSSVTQAGAANPQAAWDDLKAFMKTDEYKRIHAQIFRNEEFLDLLKFIYYANYPTIYGALKVFFDSMDQVGIELPNGPDYTPPIMFSMEDTELPQGAGNRIPTINIAPPSIKVECSLENPPSGLIPIFDILQRLNDSNIHEVIKVLLYMLQEVLGNSAMHVLLLKLGENQKGAFFRDTLRMPEMEQGMVHIQSLVLAEPGIGQMNDILKQVTGLDLGNGALFEYVVNLIMYLVWNVPFPPKA